MFPAAGCCPVAATPPVAQHCHEAAPLARKSCMYAPPTTNKLTGAVPAAAPQPFGRTVATTTADCPPDNSRHAQPTRRHRHHWGRPWDVHCAPSHPAPTRRDPFVDDDVDDSSGYSLCIGTSRSASEAVPLETPAEATDTLTEVTKSELSGAL